MGVPGEMRQFRSCPVTVSNRRNLASELLKKFRKIHEIGGKLKNMVKMQFLCQNPSLLFEITKQADLCLIISPEKAGFYAKYWCSSIKSSKNPVQTA